MSGLPVSKTHALMSVNPFGGTLPLFSIPMLQVITVKFALGVPFCSENDTVYQYPKAIKPKPAKLRKMIFFFTLVK